jgi:predicted unusual protein kinase regulating ubiquinone biosynthesis (AarF/ABC1/UbiB family)
MRYAIALRSRRAQVHERTAAALLRLCRANGGIYTKAGQLLSTAQGVPPAYRAALASLQDAAPPRAITEVDAALRAELGAPAAALFAAFESTAAAAASLAQARRLRAVWAAALRTRVIVFYTARRDAAGAPRAHARRPRRRRQGAPARVPPARHQRG